jgi:hypothetical protein
VNLTHKSTNDDPAFVSSLGSFTIDPGGRMDESNNQMLAGGATLTTIRTDLHTGLLFTTAPGGALGYGDQGGGVIMVKFTLLGDTDLDGRVNVADLANLAGNFGKTSNQFWISGDFDYNGNVNVADLADLAGNFGKDLASGGLTGASAAPAAAAAGAVPEPTASLTATAFALTALGFRRRGRYHDRL